MNVIFGVVFVAGFLSFVLAVFKGIGLSTIFNLDAFLIVVSGTVIGVFVGFPVSRIRNTLRDMISVFSDQKERRDVIKDIIKVSRKYGRTDIKSLEDEMTNCDDNFLKLGVNLLINNYEVKEIKNIMAREIALRTVNYNFSQNVLKTVARLTPSLGLVGTVISLVKMFSNFESIDTIAPLMAVALMSTFYGVVIANLFVLPVCAKIKERAIVTETLMHITIEGILAVKDMEHPLKIEERIRGYETYEETRESGIAGPWMIPKGIAAMLKS
jgi:chemotaxis protein MotA